MGTLPRPDIPPGPQRDLLDALHDLHHRAGWPSLRTLAREAGCSHTTVSNVFSSPRLPSWGVLELLVEAMNCDTTEFHQLWLAASSPGGAQPPATAGIAGRRDELAVVRRHLETGTGLLLVTGEAGIGKTKLVTTAAAGADAFVATGSCRPLSTEVPLLPIADLLRQVLSADPPWLKAALAACPAYVPAALASILPELDIHETAPVSDEWARQRLFDAVAALLVALQEERPLGFVVEDAHWADATTLDLIELLGNQSLPLVLTVRTDDPDTGEAFTGWLTRARRLPRATAVALGPLTLAETGNQLALLRGRDPEPEELARIHARSLGQPLFTEQLALHPDDQPLPELLADLLRRRLQGLGAGAWTVARALGIADRPLLAGQLAEITALDPVGGLRELDAHRLLAPADGPEIRLRHPLVADAIRTRLVPGEASDVHRQVATVLATAPDPPAAEIADHWAAAGDHDEELPWRIAAARAASARFAVESAASQWERVSELWLDDLNQAGDPPLAAAEMHIATLDAIRRLDRQAVIPLMDKALVVAAVAAPEHAAAILLRAGYVRGWLGEPEVGIELGARAVAIYADLPPCREHVRALHALRATLRSAGRFREAADVSVRAVTEARRVGINSVLKHALAQQAWHQSMGGNTQEAQASVDELAAIDLDPPDPFCEIEVAMNVTDMLLMTGAPAQELLDVAQVALDAADTWGLHQWDDAILRSNVAEALIKQGDPTSAWGLVAPHTDGDPVQKRWPLYEQRAVLELLAGRTEEARRRMAAVAAGPRPQGGGLAFRVEHAAIACAIDLWTGQPATTLERALPVLESGADTEEPAVLAPLLVLAARAAADLRDRACGEQVRTLHQRLKSDPFASHPILVTPAALGATWTAELARLEERETVDSWAAAAAAWDRLTHPYDSAYSRWRGAQVALRTGQATIAQRLLTRAARDARGHVPLTDAIRETAGSPSGRPRGGDGAKRNLHGRG